MLHTLAAQERQGVWGEDRFNHFLDALFFYTWLTTWLVFNVGFALYAKFTARREVRPGRGRVVGLHRCSSIAFQIHSHNRHLLF